MRLFKKLIPIKRNPNPDLINEQKLEIEQLNIEKLKMKADISDMDNEHKGHVKNVNDVKETHKKLKDKHIRLKDELSDLLSYIKKAKEEKSILDTQNTNLNTELATKRTNNDKEIAIQLDKAKNEENKVLESVEKLLKDEIELQEKLKAGNEKVQLLHTNSQVISEQLKDKNNELKVREAQIIKADVLLGNKISKSDDQIKTLSEINDDKDKAENEIVSKKKVIVDLDEKIKEAKEEFSKYEGRMLGFVMKEQRVNKLIPKLNKYCKLVGIKSPFNK